MWENNNAQRFILEEHVTECVQGAEELWLMHPFSDMLLFKEILQWSYKEQWAKV